jgi:hypothetical protein
MESMTIVVPRPNTEAVFSGQRPKEPAVHGHDEQLTEEAASQFQLKMGLTH